MKKIAKVEWPCEIFLDKKKILKQSMTASPKFEIIIANTNQSQNGHYVEEDEEDSQSGMTLWNIFNWKTRS